MAKIVDPDQLNLGTEVVIDTTGDPKTVQLLAAGNLDDSSPGASSGVTGQALYSFLKEEWLSNLTLNKHRFPIKAFTKFEQLWNNNFELLDALSRSILRDVGWEESVGNAAGDLYACFITLGSFDDPADQAQYAQEPGFSAAISNFTKTGEVNEPVLILDASEGVAGDFTGYFKATLNVQGKTIDSYDLLEEQALVSLEPTVYRLPLSNGVDARVSENDTNIDANAPYTGMTVAYLSGVGFTTWADAVAYPPEAVVQGSDGRWYFTDAGGTSNGDSSDLVNGSDTGVAWIEYEGERQIGTGYHAFNRIIVANNGTKAEVYEWAQRQLRKSVDINTGPIFHIEQDTFGAVNGVNAEELLTFQGEVLVTEPGVFVDDVDVNDRNNVAFHDIPVDTGGINGSGVPTNPSSTSMTYPFLAAGTLSFSLNLLDEPDVDTLYRMYFQTNPAGDFDTNDAVVVLDDSGAPIEGQITAGTIAFDFDYDGNAQGGRAPGTDATVVVVFQGLDQAEWGEAIHTINRTTGQTIPCSANDERNFFQAA